MSTAKASEVIVHEPAEAARRLGGISVATLIEILKVRGYEWTELTPGVKPWGKGGRGRKRWGLTDDQIAAVVAGQSRRHARPAPGDAPPPKPKGTIPGWDGKRRLGPRGKPAAS
jgi:hypothetical protein